MRIGILGTGGVARTVGDRLIALGHEVRLGSRDPANPVAAAWVAGRDAASHDGSAGAATFGDLVVNATPGLASESVIAGVADALDGTPLLDLANPLDFSGGFPPLVVHSDGVSLAERLQAAAPGARVVKALNMVTADVMLDPGRLGEPTATFVAADDADAKAVVTQLLIDAGWQADQVIDLGGLSAARGMESYLLLWLATFGALGTADFNLRLVR
jgi:8-hydroxy-5-deazaflavin:NADPH oxidoreductase